MKAINLLLICLSLLFVACQKEKKTNEAALKMQDFVVEIANYAHQFDSNFMVIPQNGVELAFKNLDPEQGFQQAYLEAIDGFGVEELFYNGNYQPDTDRLNMLRRLVASKKILVADYLKDNNQVQDALTKNQAEGFVSFPRLKDNYHYTQIPTTVNNENNFDIQDLAAVQNYLYLISTDSFSSKEVMLAAIRATNFDLIIMDLYFNEMELTASEIQQLKTKANGGTRLVVCYLNIGSAENYRYYWEEGWRLHHPSWLKKRYEGYKDEIWVAYWSAEWKQIIFGNEASYLKRIIQAGFDGAYLDNVEAYYFLYHR